MKEVEKKNVVMELIQKAELPKDLSILLGQLTMIVLIPAVLGAPVALAHFMLSKDTDHPPLPEHLCGIMITSTLIGLGRIGYIVLKYSSRQ